MAEEKGLRYILKDGRMHGTLGYPIGHVETDDSGERWVVHRNSNQVFMWVAYEQKQSWGFVPMPVTEIKPNHTYLLGVDPDIWGHSEDARRLLEELEANFPESKFVFAAGLYSVSEKPNGD